MTPAGLACIFGNIRDIVHASAGVIHGTGVTTAAAAYQPNDRQTYGRGKDR